MANKKGSKSGESDSQPRSMKSRILTILETIDRPINFCASGPFASMHPGLSVDGLGDVALPLSATDAKQLIQHCEQAPYGKGTETVVDTKVRKVWELDASRFSIANPKWEPALESVLREIETKLGLPKKSLAAHPYKMLVYEKGSFFLPHRDGEKIDRMVATLVVNLPSKYAGGELIICHQGMTETITMPGAASGLEIEYAAFYADCQHEVKPLLSGYRLCLTYNLVLAQPKTSAIGAPNFEEAAQKIAAILDDWPLEESEESAEEDDDEDAEEDDDDGYYYGDRVDDTQTPSKLAVMLDHQYSEDGLSIDNLKGVDLSRANILFDAAERADCDAHLALVTLWETGSAEDEYGNSGGYHYGDDDDDVSPSDFRIGELIDSSFTAKHWSDREGKKVVFGEIPLKFREVVSKVDIRETDPSRAELEGYTGNAGMTLERWYHRAAIILWPRRNQVRIWRNAGTDAAIAGLNTLYTQLNKTKKDRSVRLEECRELAQQIMQSWSPIRLKSSWEPDYVKENEQALKNREMFWNLLIELGTPDLICNALEKVLPKDGLLPVPSSFLQWLEKEGWESYRESILSVANQTNAGNFGRNGAFFRQLATLPKIPAERKQLCNEMAPILLDALEKIESEHHYSPYTSETARGTLTVDVAQGLVAVGNEKLLERFFNWLFPHKKYNIDKVQMPAISMLADRSPEVITGSQAVQAWIQRIVQELEGETRQEPTKPADWRRESKLTCQCADCQRLATFLDDPTQPQARWPMAEGRRRHIESTISASHCECKAETLRQGSPYSLVCTKTFRLYELACTTYQQNLAHLATLEKITGLWKSKPKKAAKGTK